MKKPLQEYPHLFSNGKFKAYVDHQDVYDVLGVIGNNSIYLDDPVLEDIYNIEIERCTLIARPISDMTIPEAHKAIRMLPFDMSADEYRDLNGFVGNTDQFLYLLSIGVYPFDQSHFKKGTVIDSTTIK